MAVKINAGDDVKRRDYFFVNPYEVVVREELRGRSRPPAEKDIIERAMSMVKHGQLQPVVCRKIENDRILLIAGFTRTASARLIREGFTGIDGKKYKDEKFALKVVLTTCNDKESFLQNYEENRSRKDLSPIDEAHNQNRMREQWGYSDADIARELGVDQPVVARFKKLLLLEEEIQDRVHEGSLPVSGALELLELPADKREEAIAAATKENGKVVATKIKDQVRDHHLADADEVDDNQEEESEPDGEANNARPLKVRSRSVKQLREFFESENGPANDPAIRRFCQDMVKYINGQSSDRQMQNAMNRLLEAEKTPDEEN